MTCISEHTYIWFIFLGYGPYINSYGPYINRYGRHVLLIGQMYFILAHIVRYGWFFILTRYLHIWNGWDLFFIYNNFDMGDVYVMWLRTLWYGQDIARYMWHPFHMGYITYIWTRCADIDDSYFIKARYSSDFFNMSDKCLI